MEDIENILKELNIEIACAEYSGKNRISVSVKVLKATTQAIYEMLEKIEQQGGEFVG